MTDVFISYSHKDFEYAHHLADEFRRRNIDVWIDDRIDYGEEWPRTIQKNLASCRSFIVIMSTNAFDSMWVQNEVSYAQANHKTIFPLLLEGDVWLSMASMQYVDVRGGKMPPDRFFEKIQNSLRQPALPPLASQEATPTRNPGKLHAPSGHKTGLFSASLLLVFAVLSLILYKVRNPGSSTPVTEAPTGFPITKMRPTETPTESPLTSTPPVTVKVRTEITSEPSITPTPFGGGLGQIAFISERDGNWEGYLMNSDGTDQRNVTNNPAVDSGIYLSPDGKKIVFDSNRGANADIYVANPDGSNPTRLTDHSAIDGGPHWSPDGTRIAFSSERDGNWEVYVMKIDGSMIIRLTDNPADDGVPSFSSQGDRVVFHSNRDGNWEIYIVNTNATGLTRLTEDQANDEYPSWSPDGRRIVFSSDRDGDYQIYSMNIDGSQLIKLTESPGYDSRPIW